METEKKLSRRGLFKTWGSVAGGSILGGTLLGASLASHWPGKAFGAEKGRIPWKTLGTSGVKVPVLQLGTAQSMDPRYDRIMHRCYKEGVTAIDTALAYGWGASHEAVANFLKQTNDRKNLWLTSKSKAWTVKGFLSDADKALADLKTDYLDLFLMHGINSVDYLEKDFLRAGEKLKKAGKTRLFGFSCHGGRVVELINKAAQTGGVDAILFRYNFRKYGDKALNQAMDRAHKAGIGLMAMKTNGAVPESAQKVVRFRSKNFNIEQAKLKSVWADERVSTIVSEMDSLQVVAENVAAARSQVALSAGESHQLNRLAALSAHAACNGCENICQSISQSSPGGTPLAIADTLRIFSYHEAHGDHARAKRLFGELPEVARRFQGVDFSAAQNACPQGIDIAQRLELATRALS